MAQALSLSLLKGKSPSVELGDPEAAGASGVSPCGSDGSPLAGGSTGGSTGGKGGKGGKGVRKNNKKRKAERAAVQTHQGAEDEYASVKSQAHKRHELADSPGVSPRQIFTAEQPQIPRCCWFNLWSVKEVKQGRGTLVLTERQRHGVPSAEGSQPVPVPSAETTLSLWVGGGVPPPNTRFGRVGDVTWHLCGSSGSVRTERVPPSLARRTGLKIMACFQTRRSCVITDRMGNTDSTCVY